MQRRLLVDNSSLMSPLAEKFVVMPIGCRHFRGKYETTSITLQNS